ncbi:MAG: hypothetical protein WC147_06300 [Syntrophomonas sp.]|nr:hypothetical protein [Clostridiaceae bacterium]
MFLVIAIAGLSFDAPKTYSLEVQQAAFGNWNKTFEEANGRFDDSWDTSQNAIKGLSNGNINAYQAYNTFAMGETR